MGNDFHAKREDRVRTLTSLSVSASAYEKPLGIPPCHKDHEPPSTTEVW